MAGLFSSTEFVHIRCLYRFDDDPQRIADDILKNGTYGIVTVGYGPSVTDEAALQAISGGAACSFIAKGPASLMKQVEAVKRLIDKAEANGGKYCAMN
ncbi:hypothetical protein TELCIR_18622 [Teladorsagia circumcincta]|uniref:Uncharacterized protein n=1 Tax=Teladorsagia circumcincta TaxID=45464 RepID=A0A2G9TPK0_TELCI|nr:hypothetical protein TELCIR_18622 [Teladorsagia circumcincta]